MSPQKISEIVDNFLSKINLAIECEKRIIDETAKLIVEIQRMSMQAVRNLKEKKKKLVNLMMNSQKIINIKEVKEIEWQLRRCFEIYIPKPQLKGIQDFYASNFLLSTNRIASLSVEDATNHLAESHNLFLEGHSGRVNSLAKTSDDRYIVSGSDDNTVRVWSLQDRTQESVLFGHKDRIYSIALTRDNKYIVSGSSDGTIIIWSFHDETIEAVLNGKAGTVLAVATTSDSKYIVSGSGDCSARVWSIQIKTQEAV